MSQRSCWKRPALSPDSKEQLAPQGRPPPKNLKSAPQKRKRNNGREVWTRRLIDWIAHWSAKCSEACLERCPGKRAIDLIKCSKDCTWFHVTSG